MNQATYHRQLLEIVGLKSSEETQAWGRSLGETLGPNTVILLLGDLGAGKTTLIQGLGQGLAIEEPIVSPTFTLINEYHDGRLPLYHFDLYRLEGAEVDEIYPELYWEGEEVPPGIVAIEWGQRLSYLPEDYLQIELGFREDGGRQGQLFRYRQRSLTN